MSMSMSMVVRWVLVRSVLLCIRRRLTTSNSTSTKRNSSSSMRAMVAWAVVLGEGMRGIM